MCNGFFKYSLILIAPLLAIGQTAPISKQALAGVRVEKSQALPSPVLGRHFFAHLTALEQEGDRAEASGKSAAIYRDYYKKLLGLTPQQYQAVKCIATQTHAQLKQIDQQAQSAAQDFRRQLAAAKGEQRPTVPAALKQLQEQRDAVTTAALSQLKAQLGDSSFERLSATISAQFRKQVPEQKLAAPQHPQHTSDPAAPSLGTTPVLR